MRELAKSVTSFSWAVSVLGAQQVLNLVRNPVPTSDHAGARQLGAVGQAAQSQLTGVFQRTFEAGDQLQRSALDLAFGVVSLQALDPNRLVALSGEVLRRSTALVGSVLPGGASTAGCGDCGSQPCGWGPMPPAR